MTTTDTTCGSRGPRIGNEGVPVCVLPKMHEGRHVPDESWLSAIRDWSDHAFAGVANMDLADREQEGAEAAAQLTYQRVERAAKNLITQTFVWINEGDDDETTLVARRRLIRNFADELGLTIADA